MGSERPARGAWRVGLRGLLRCCELVRDLGAERVGERGHASASGGGQEGFRADGVTLECQFSRAVIHGSGRARRPAVPCAATRPEPRREGVPQRLSASASRSRNGTWVSLRRSRAWARSNQATRSISGNASSRPDPGGHSIENVLLRAAAGSRSPGSAHAWTSSPRCRIVPSAMAPSSGAAWPVSSVNSRRAQRPPGPPRLSPRPFGMVQAPKVLRRVEGPPGMGQEHLEGRVSTAVEEDSRADAIGHGEILADPRRPHAQARPAWARLETLASAAAARSVGRCGCGSWHDPIPSTSAPTARITRPERCRARRRASVVRRPGVRVGASRVAIAGIFTAASAPRKPGVRASGDARAPTVAGGPALCAA